MILFRSASKLVESFLIFFMDKYIRKMIKTCMRVMNTKFRIVVTGYIWDQNGGEVVVDYTEVVVDYTWGFDSIHNDLFLRTKS